MGVLRDAGTSTSGTPATKLAEIAISTGTEIIDWTMFCGQANAANTTYRIIVTYTDDTTTTIDSAAATAHEHHVNAGGAFRQAIGISDALIALDAKSVKRLRVETLGSGTGARFAAISGVEV